MLASFLATSEVAVRIDRSQCLRRCSLIVFRDVFVEIAAEIGPLAIVSRAYVIMLVTIDINDFGIINNAV